jgi:hypothetical protein
MELTEESENVVGLIPMVSERKQRCAIVKTIKILRTS